MSNTGHHGNNVLIDISDEDRALAQLPISLRDFVLFHAGDNFNVIQMVEAYDPFLGPSWSDIERMVKEFSRNDHKSYYGGVYPGVQRTITAKEGRQHTAADKRPTVNALRMLRRSGCVRSRRDFRRIAVFFSDLTGT